MIQVLINYKQMIKPGVTSLVLMTVIPGLYLGSKDSFPSLNLILIVLFGTFLMCAASFIFNQVFEKETDAKMKRTRDRPLPSGRVSVLQASIVGILCVLVSFVILWYKINLLTAICNFFGFISYVFLYTVFLKPRTEQNIVIGGIAGCVGPLIGYAAVSNSLPIPAWILFFIIFLWTPPHFWALAIFLKDQYSDANFPMLPVVRGEKETAKQIFIYTILYVLICSSFSFFEDSMGLIYIFVNGILSILMIFFVFSLLRDPSKKMARFVFFFSIIHLYGINIAMVVDKFIE